MSVLRVLIVSAMSAKGTSKLAAITSSRCYFLCPFRHMGRIFVWLRSTAPSAPKHPYAAVQHPNPLLMWLRHCLRLPHALAAPSALATSN